MNNIKLDWETTQKKVSELIPHSSNPRKISKKQMRDLQKSIIDFNLVEIPVVDTDNTIIAGHQRIKVLLNLGRGDEMIDVRIPSRALSKEERERYLIASNALGGEWDVTKLKIFESDFLLDIGFDEHILTSLWDKQKANNLLNESFDEKKTLATIKKYRMSYGDIAVLGKHRLICGDSTDPNIVQKLCGTTKISMIYSDPVYNINIDYNKGVGGKQSCGGSVNDDRSDTDYADLIEKSLTHALNHSHKDVHVFYWSDQNYIWLIQTMYQKMGISHKRVCLWVKNAHNPTPGVAFHKCYEPCTYGIRGTPFLAKKYDGTEILNAEIGNGNDTFNDMWTVNRLKQEEYTHATSKPPTLHYSAIKRCTKPGDVILDSFLGSGSTLIAGETLGRIVYGIELEPVFCELIMKRWESLTGKQAKIIHEASS
jgi:DNA modification methylase